MITYKNILPLLITMSLISSCSRDPNCPKATETYYKISEEDKSKIPFSSNKYEDTLVFISDAGDTAALIGEGLRHYNLAKPYIGNPDCGVTHTDYFENRMFTFLSGVNSKLSQINLNNTFNEISKETIVEISIDNLERIKAGFDFINYDINYNDSLLLNGKYIKGVNLSGYLLYNKQFGILKIVYGSVTWIRIL